jgi:hypothetical protein
VNAWSGRACDQQSAVAADVPRAAACSSEFDGGRSGCHGGTGERGHGGAVERGLRDGGRSGCHGGTGERGHGGAVERGLRVSEGRA